MSFYEELKRRNVVRVGIAYIVIGWILAQVAEFAFDNFGAPDWVLKSFVTLLLLGLPIVLFFAWAFEVTPEGVKREKDIDRSQSITQRTGRKLDVTIAVLLVVGIAFLAYEQFSSTGTTAETAATESEQSIAVLPFVDLSDGQNDNYFGQGIAEELLNALTQFPNLRVAARTSAFAFAGKNVNLREVAETLGVAHVLEGSVRRSGDKLRITAQLIRAEDGFHLWSETYERPMTDVFTIQDEIVRELSLVLQVRLGVGVGSGRAHNKNIDPRAYENYLRGLQFWSNRHVNENRRDAIAAFRLASELDSGFADAWAAYALSLLHSSTDEYTIGLPGEGRLATIEQALATAIEIDSSSARAHAGLALLYGRNFLDLEKSVFHADEALRLSPNSAATRYARSSAAIVRGDYVAAKREMYHARSLDPLNIVVERVEAGNNLITGDWTSAEDFYTECIRSDCEGPVFPRLFFALMKWQTGDMEGALQLLTSLRPALNNQPTLAFSNRQAEGSVELLIMAAEGRVTDVSSTLKRDDFDEIAPWVRFVMLDLLAENHEFDQVIQLLDHAYQTSNLFNFSGSMSNFAVGEFEFTDEFRRYQPYRDFWAQPGLAELAVARIANGHPEGLPLNDDGTPVDYSR